MDIHPIDEALTSEILRDFARYKINVQSRSQLTVDEYLLDLRIFFKFVKAYRARSKNSRDPYTEEEIYSVPIDDCNDDFIRTINADDIYSFIDYLRGDRDIKPRSIQRKLSAIKSLFKFATTTRVIKTNPARDIDHSASKVTLPKYLTLTESEDLLNTISSEKDSITKKRDYAIILTFLNTGMRLSELVSINMEDFDRDFTSLIVTGKRSKQRIIYINEAVKLAISDYRAALSDEQKAVTDPKSKNRHPVFLSNRNARISNKTVQWLVGKHLKEAGFEYKQLSTHKLRHTAATLMYREGGVDVRVLQDILGHEQLSTTQIYTHVASEDVERAVRKNPLANFKPDTDGDDE
ncbi:MAG: tyrosine-type recombinase/integrase [Clostridia bacterium]|nr:tyrosine-type recombinase/integrase [Clostridia bacterium]